MGTKKYEDKLCEGCGRPYKAKRAWSKYCTPECGKRVVEIYNQLLADVRGPIKEAAKKMVKLQQRENNE